MRYILTLLAGLLTGAVLVFVLFVGAPRAKQLAGAPVRAPEAGGDAPGTAVLALDEAFFAQLLGTIFRDLGAPKFPLRAAATNDSTYAGTNVSSAVQFDSWHSKDTIRPVHFVALQTDNCPGEIELAQESGGAKTEVRLTDGKIIAPLAFSGSYNAFGTCYRFRGIAETDIQLAFNAERQTLYGQVNVAGVNLEGASPLIGGLITPLVQEAINRRVNPIEMLRASQLALAIPVQSTGGTLKAQVKDVRSEVKDNALRLHITYDFSGARGAGQQPQSPQS
ncbi:MAG: hypothetical protein ABR577_15825 [Pyrinomonadaceae bacterium]